MVISSSIIELMAITLAWAEDRERLEESELLVQTQTEQQRCQDGGLVGGVAVRGASAWGRNSVQGFRSVCAKPCDKSLFLKVTGKNLFLETKSVNIPEDKTSNSVQAVVSWTRCVCMKAASRQLGT